VTTPDRTAVAQSLAAAAAAGIHRLEIPTPFLVGRVNCYLIEDDPLTLVDTGPNSDKSLDTLSRALAEHGRQIEDLELIVITHQHVDHLGLLETLTRRSHAEVAALDLLAPYLDDFSASAAADDEFALRMLRRHGAPADLTAVLASVSAAYRSYGSSGNVTRPLHDGDQIAMRDRTLRVAHRPGHSPSDTILFDEQRQILIAGDHLLAGISSNPLLSRPLAPGVGAVRPQALIDYRASLRATRALPAKLVLSGHGAPITDHVELIDERFRGHERRARKLLRMLGSGPLSAFELAQQMWGNVAVAQAYLTISEVLGHIDLLIARGAVSEVDDGRLTRFQAPDEGG
jgi:glyoxylase-like metal-dependent hydrolase (beta-lactamase superfamily II)